MDFKNKATEFFKKKDFQTAIQYFKLAIQNLPIHEANECERAKIFSNISLCYSLLGDYLSSLDYAERAINEKSDWYKGYFRKCTTLMRLNQKRECAEFILDANLRKRHFDGVPEKENNVISDFLVSCKYFSHRKVIQTFQCFKKIFYKDNIVVIDAHNRGHYDSIVTFAVEFIDEKKLFKDVKSGVIPQLSRKESKQALERLKNCSIVFLEGVHFVRCPTMFTMVIENLQLIGEGDPNSVILRKSPHSTLPIGILQATGQHISDPMLYINLQIGDIHIDNLRIENVRKDDLDEHIDKIVEDDRKKNPKRTYGIMDDLMKKFTKMRDQKRGNNTGILFWDVHKNHALRVNRKIVVSNCTFESPNGDGISIWLPQYPCRISILNCVFERSYQGISVMSLSSKSNLLIDGCFVNKIDNFGIGISQMDTEFLLSEMRQNEDPSFHTFSDVPDGRNNTEIGCVIRNSKVYSCGSNSIRLVKARALIENCDVRSVGITGISINSNSDGIVRNCSIRGCHEKNGRAIAVYRNSRGLIEGNKIRKMKGCAIWFAISSSGIVKYNDIRTSADGIGIFDNENGGTIEVEGNTFKGIRNKKIFYDSRCKPPLLRNQRKSDLVVAEYNFSKENVSEVFKDTKKQMNKHKKQFRRSSQLRGRAIICSGCVRIEQTNERFKICSQCRDARYCSRKCQKDHWKRGHKKQCKILQREMKGF